MPQFRNFEHYYEKRYKKCWLKQIIILSEAGSALYPNPAIFRRCFSAVKIAPSESQCSSLRKMIKICAFSSIDY